MFKSVALALVLAASVVCAADDPSAFALNAVVIGGASRTDFAIGILEARAAVLPVLTVSAAPTIVAVEGGDTERQLRAALTVHLPLGVMRLDNRNMWVWNDTGRTRYRNRVRLTAPAEVGGHALRPQLIGEVFYERGGPGWYRRLYGVGVGWDVSSSLTADAYWTVQDDDGRDRASLFFLVLSARLR